MNSFKNTHLTPYLWHKVLSWMNLNELKKFVNIIDSSIKFGKLNQIIERCVLEFMQIKKNHSFEKETIILCTILIENNKDLSYLNHQEFISLKEASEVNLFLKKIILW